MSFLVREVIMDAMMGVPARVRLELAVESLTMVTSGWRGCMNGQGCARVVLA